MSKIVYWSYLGQQPMRATAPQDVRKNFYSRNLHDNTPSLSFNKCPFSHDHLENLYSLHSLYDYSFRIEGKIARSYDYDQDFFNYHVSVRSVEKKIFSFFQPYIFFTESDSLEVSFPVFPHLENNNITKRCMPFEGTIDIGRYFRNVDFAFMLKDPYEEFIIERDEIFGYVKFHTKEKIRLKQFYPTETIKKYSDDVNDLLNNKKDKFYRPEYYYNSFKLKKLILKEIKSNLVD